MAEINVRSAYYWDFYVLLKTFAKPKNTRMLTFYKKWFKVDEIHQMYSSFALEISTHSSLPTYSGVLMVL